MDCLKQEKSPRSVPDLAEVPKYLKKYDLNLEVVLDQVVVAKDGKVVPHEAASNIAWDAEFFYNDEFTSVAKQYEIIGVPTLYFINKEGIIKLVENSVPKDFEKILLEGK